MNRHNNRSVNRSFKKSVNYHADHDAASSSESCASSGGGEINSTVLPRRTVFGERFAKLEEGEKVRNIMESKFVRWLESHELEHEVVVVHRNVCSNVMLQAKVHCFHIFMRAVAKLREGDPNVKYAWYGASSKGEIDDIVEHGFGGKNLNNGLRLSPEDSPLESVKRSVADKHGLRHMLLCRVILGRTELVQSGSDQWRPSSEEFDSGVVESVSAPKEYVVWCSKINTHVLPEFVLSFNLPSSSSAGRVKIEQPLRPTSPWMPFPALIALLSRTLPSPDITMINKYHKDYAEKKISRQELIQKVRVIAGDTLLASIIRTFRARKIPASCLKLIRSKNGNRPGSNGVE
ncbi:hypothetical protein Lal_00049748 [Lupinus albus]|uniref:Putative poly(ADP-ribose) polymerase, catalytic domain, RST domain of plant n=1 Tax=Lupinus albus TaxID=3870 RepID=A0A6A4PMU7_LUPAL|nr:putative poly(ADP-ribose) polymerase, catalytic domain, RST domain of plant [Lupinus albus]KAF1867319.1 hypothetical protein Lal_00049748 [Lupinus albus]